MSTCLFFSVDTAAELAQQLGYSLGYARRGFEQMLLRAQRPTVDHLNGATSFFVEHLVVIANRLELNSLEVALHLPDFDRVFLTLPGVRNKSLCIVRATVPELRKHLTVKTPLAK